MNAIHLPPTPRLRAAIFVNLVAMRKSLSLKQGPIMQEDNLQKLQQASFLYHAAHNCVLLQVCLHLAPSCYLFCVPGFQGLLKRPLIRGNASGNCARNNTSVGLRTVHATCMCCADVCHDVLRLDHLCLDQARVISPLWSSCSTDEDLVTRLQNCMFLFKRCASLRCSIEVGKIKCIAVMSHPRRLGRQVISRYACYTCVRWLRKLEMDGNWIYISCTPVCSQSRHINCTGPLYFPSRLWNAELVRQSAGESSGRCGGKLGKDRETTHLILISAPLIIKCLLNHHVSASIYVLIINHLKHLLNIKK